MIINSGIKEVVIYEGYPDDLAREMLKEAGISVKNIERKQGLKHGKSVKQG